MEAAISPSRGVDEHPRGPRPPTSIELRRALRTACALAAAAVSGYCLHRVTTFVGDEAARLEATEQRSANDHRPTMATRSAILNGRGALDPHSRRSRHAYDRSKVPVLSDRLQALAELHLGYVEAAAAGRGDRGGPTSPAALAAAAAVGAAAVAEDAPSASNVDPRPEAGQAQTRRGRRKEATTVLRPNLVVVLFDDAGYGDLGVHATERGDVSHTPFLDQLAK